MTVGEKIQKYRKEMGLSQEELGQKLLISRQTVSLWEMDKTLPTIDNLKRLKEIFGVSLDEMLEEDSKEGNIELPLEKYNFEFEDKEIKEITGFNIKNLLPRLAIILFLLAMVLVLCIVSGGGYFYFLFGVAFVTARYFSSMRTFFTLRKQTYARMGTQIYEYEIFNDYFTVRITNKAGEEIYKRKCFFTQISNMYEAKNYVLLVVDNTRDGCFALRKSDLCQNSFIYSFKGKNPTRVKYIPFQFPLRNIYFAGAVLTGIAILTVACLLFTSPVYDLFRGRLWWLYCLLSVFPILCGVVGIIQKKRGEGGILKIIVAFILALCFLIVGYTALFFDFPNKEFKAELEKTVADEYDSPMLIDVFILKKDGEHVDNICIFTTESNGLVLGTFYYYPDEGNIIYYDEYADNIRRNVTYGFLATTSDYFVYYGLYDDVSEFPSEYYEYREIEVDQSRKYICFYSIELFEK